MEVLLSKKEKGKGHLVVKQKSGSVRERKEEKPSLVDVSRDCSSIQAVLLIQSELINKVVGTSRHP